MARLGGDEFTILLEDIVDVRYAIGVAERIEEALREPFPIDGHEATVTASIGIAVSSGRDATPEDLMRNSDQAMYQAKRKGRARHELFALATATEDRSSAAVTEEGTEGVWRAGRSWRPRSAAEAAIEDAIVIEHAEAAPLDDGDDEEPAGAAVRPRPSARRRPSRSGAGRAGAEPARARAGRARATATRRAREAPESDDALRLRSRAHRGAPAPPAALSPARRNACRAWSTPRNATRRRRLGYGAAGRRSNSRHADPLHRRGMGAEQEPVRAGGIGVGHVREREPALQLDELARLAGELERVGVGPALDRPRELVRDDGQAERDQGQRERERGQRPGRARCARRPGRSSAA